MTSVEQGWETAAARVDFPVAVIASGVTEPPRMTQWGGETDNPRSVTLSHGSDDVDVTTYPEIMWGGDLAEVWKDLTAFVESSFGFAWEGRETALPEGRARRQRAASEAEHRLVALPLDGSPVQATVVGDSEDWSAGFETIWKGGPLVILLSGRATAIESLKLELVDDLLSHLSQSGRRGSNPRPSPRLEPIQAVLGEIEDEEGR